MDKINLQVIRESFGRVAWSHKTHEKAAEIEERRAKKVKWINVVLTFLTFLSFSTSMVFPAEAWSVYIAVVLSALTLAFNFYLLSFNPEKIAEQHRYVAKELWGVREKYVNFIADIVNKKISNEDIVTRKDQFIKDLKIIYKFAPQTNPEAYGEADNALKNNEELTFSNEEINRFLPKELHIIE
ncbi:MAG: SLATT domain-containing protein [bacterium]|nr:SLATT domain-containing protein [bacterium]